MQGIIPNKFRKTDNCAAGYSLRKNFIAIPIQSKRNRPERDKITAINKLFFIDNN